VQGTQTGSTKPNRKTFYGNKKKSMNFEPFAKPSLSVTQSIQKEPKEQFH
jgi:hypothetical protein